MRAVLLIFRIEHCAGLAAQQNARPALTEDGQPQREADADPNVHFGKRSFSSNGSYRYSPESSVALTRHLDHAEVVWRGGTTDPLLASASVSHRTMPPEPRSPVLIRSTVILNTAIRGMPRLRDL